MLAFAAIPSTQAAAFDYVPLLFVAYVIYAIVSGLVKAARQAQRVLSQPAPAGQSLTAGQPVTVDQVRATLALRRAATARVQQPAAAPASPVVVRLSSQPSALAFPAGAATNAQMDALAPMSYSNSLGIISGSMDISALLASLPPAAQAIVASAVIGPCAAHRGGGHIPEDW
jgi:hypothetical protein